jgi:hypothetical protein
MTCLLSTTSVCTGLLRCRFECTGHLRFAAHALDGIHHTALLREKRVAEIGCPLNVIGQAA